MQVVYNSNLNQTFHIPLGNGSFEQITFKPFINHIKSSVELVNPYRWVNGSAPTLQYGGQRNNAAADADLNDGWTEIGMYPYDDTSLVAGNNHSSFQNPGKTIHRTFDINLNMKFYATESYVDANANSGQLNRRTILAHELLHGVGLDHVPSKVSKLMQKDIIGVNIIAPGFDEQKGFNCLWNNKDCNYEGTGDINYTVSSLDNKLKWEIETNSNNLIGFNIYKINKKNEYLTINTSLIKYDSEINSYSYNTKNIENEYFLEIVYEDMLNNKFIKF